MKIAILGFGVEGQSAYRYFRSPKSGDRSPLANSELRTPDSEITICDAKPDLEMPEGVESRLGPDYLTKLESFDLIVRSPGIYPQAIREANPGVDLSQRISSVTREFLDKCPAPVIGVTGTKGKGTTATLISKMLEAAGKTVWLGGNIGRPALDFLDAVKPTDYVVLELSSFQLIDVTRSPQIAVMLMVAPDHLNYHQDMAEYIEAKSSIFRFQKPTDTAVYNALNPIAARAAQLSPGRKVPFAALSPSSSTGSRAELYSSEALRIGDLPEDPPVKPWDDEKSGGRVHVKEDQIWMNDTVICSVSDVGLIGPHNLENVCAAVAAAWHALYLSEAHGSGQIVPDAEPLLRAIKAFTGLPHRLELVGVAKGVHFYDDSFAVTPEAAMAALRSFEQPKVVILGGSSKGAKFDDLAEVVKESNVKKVIVIGQEAPKIKAALDKVGFNDYVLGSTTMPEIVKSASDLAEAGDVVLLCPGCASFDMFRDYKDRGEQFRAAVASLSRHSGPPDRGPGQATAEDPESLDQETLKQVQGDSKKSKYDKFIFKDYSFDDTSQTLKLTYALDQAVTFTETIQFKFDVIPDYNREAFDRACFGLFIMAGVSYYKAYLPAEVEIAKGGLTPDQKRFFDNIYQLGLGEFYYHNKLNPNDSINFPVNSAAAVKTVPISGLSGSLLPVGGGKDSLVAAEILESEGVDFSTWIVNQSAKLRPLLEKIDHPHLEVSRTIAPELLELNARDALNGHVPITAILCFMAVGSAILAGRENVILAIESSAGEGNLVYHGIKINHQYSKTLEFERDLQSYVRNYISPSVQVFSLLRPLTELKIAEILARKGLKKYLGNFSSCNRNYHIGLKQEVFWCGRCPKCAFVFLILAPFVPKADLEGIFEGQNLFLVPELKSTFDELLGLSGSKPFECVGEIQESRQAIKLALATGDYPELARYQFSDPEFNYLELRESAMPAEFDQSLRHFLDSLGE